MSEQEDGLGPEDQLFTEAAAWFARMRDDDHPETRLELERWLALGALHRKAYNRAVEVFTLGKVLEEDDVTAGTSSPGPVRAEASAPEPDPIEDPYSHAPIRRTRLVAALAIILAAVAGTTTLGLWLRAEAQRRPGASATQVAQLVARERARILRLADGSTVRLQPGTILDVAFGPSERRSRLEAGLARFQVAHERRPFIVFAGGGSVTAHGTLFDVDMTAPKAVAVRLIEGVVDVRLPASAAPHGLRGTVQRLHSGQSIRFAAERSASLGPAKAARAVGSPPPAPARQPSATTVDASAVPQDQAREFDEIRVADLVALANREARRPIRLADPRISEERISGRFRIGNADLLAERIALLFDLVVDRSDPNGLTLRAR